MNEKNLTYLKDNLKYLGFGENLGDALQQQMAQGNKEFTLHLQTEINKKPFSAMLHFRKGDNADMYFLNKWEGALRTEAGKEAQTFYVNKGHGVTLKEGFNLLEGRSVYKELTGKEGQKYHAWLELDKTTIDPNKNYKMSQYHENYGFDLEKVLSAFPIKELSDPTQKEALKKSLEKGNVQAVSFEKNGSIEKLFIEARPQFKSINAYDMNGQRIPMSNLERRFDLNLRQEIKDDVTLIGNAREKINNKEVPLSTPSEIKKNDETAVKKGRQKTRGEGLLSKKAEGNGLMEKKRTSHKKGQHL